MKSMPRPFDGDLPYRRDSITESKAEKDKQVSFADLIEKSLPENLR
jgi:hypothetical protein